MKLTKCILEGTMRSRMIWMFLLAVAVIATPAARADSFTFNVDYCTNPCLGGVAANNNGGTITLTQDGADQVIVDVSLNNLVFHDQGLTSFAFNILGNPTLALVSSITGSGQITILNGFGGTWAFSQPAGNTDGAGKTFGYAFDCTAGAGACAGSPDELIFEVKFTGLTPASFETLTGAITGKGQTFTNVDFAANVANGGCTGVIGAGNGTAPSTAATLNPGGTACTIATPEPGSLAFFGTGSLALLGSGLIGLGSLVRKRFLGRR